MHACYFHNLAERCYSTARDCVDRREQEEFRRLGDDLIQRAKKLRLRPHAVFSSAARELVRAYASSQPFVGVDKVIE